MKIILSSALLLAAVLNLPAQEKIPDFGKISLQELTMKECPFEKGADAMNLLKTAKMEFTVRNFSGEPEVSTDYRVRIKIFNEHGYSAANIRIPFFRHSRSVKITDIEGYIYWLDSTGKVVREKLGKKEILKEKTKASDAKSYVAFTFPDLHAGSVIEYRYTLTNKNSVSIEPWFFQDIIPTGYSSITSDIPAYGQMTYHVLASDPVERDSSYKKYSNSIYNEDIRTFRMRNIHGFRMEPMMTSLKDNLQRIEFSLSPPTLLSVLISKPDDRLRFYNFLLLRARYFGKQFETTLPETDSFTDSVKQLSTIRQKTEAVYNYVRKKIEWNGEQMFYCDSLQECWKNKSGSSAEMNLLLLNLLRKAGVNCYPILVSTHENGNPDVDFGSMSQFNGVDVYVVDGTSYYLLDCTQKYLSLEMPPLNVLNTNAYLVDSEKYGWQFIVNQKILLKKDAQVNARLDSAGNVRGTMALGSYGFGKSDELEEQSKLKKKNESKEEDLSDIQETISIDSAFLINPDYNDSLLEKALFHYTPSTSGDILFLDPSSFFGFKKNPFTDSVRYSDVDFGCNQSFSLDFNLEIPRNFSLESALGEISVYKNDSAASYVRNLTLNGHTLRIRSKFTLSNTIFTRDDYSPLKTFFDKFYTLLQQKIILKKNS